MQGFDKSLGIFTNLVRKSTERLSHNTELCRSRLVSDNNKWLDEVKKIVNKSDKKADMAN